MFNLALAGSMLAVLLVPSALTGPAAPAPADSASAAAAAVAAPASGVTLDVLTVNGSGCPAGTASVRVSPDNTAFTVVYGDFVAKDGGSAAPTDIRKNCQINLRINVPQGFTYAIAKAVYRGWANLAAGASGLEQAAYYFQGSSDTTYVPHEFTGPYSGSWQTVDVTDAAALVWSPCGLQRNLNINTELRVDAGTSNASATSSMAMSSTRGSVQTVYQLSWRSCS